MIRAVRHAGVVVRDLDRMLSFYRDILGFSVAARAEESGAFIDRLLGVPGTVVTTVKLAAPEGGALLELLRFRSPPSDDRKLPTVKSYGLTHVALTVPSLEALVPQLTAAGAVFVNPPQVSPNGKVIVAYCSDPEGNYLELVEEL